MRPPRRIGAGVALAFFLPGGTSGFSLRMSTGATDFANMALRQSPSSTQFYTNKMCPYAQKVWIALEYASAPYSLEEVPLYGPGGKPDWFLDINPAGQVPVLTCHGGARIYIDSENILNKIAEGAVEGGEALGPKDEATEERAEEWRHLVENRLNPMGKAAVQRGGKRVDELMGLLRELDGKVRGPYLAGPAVTLADCAAFPFLWRIDDEFGPLEEGGGHGKLREWLDRCMDNPAFAKTVQTSWWWWW